MAQEPTIGFLLKQLHDRVKQLVDNELQPFGLTMTQARFLQFLRMRMGQPTTAKDFEEHFGISHPTVVGVLKRLKQKELICSEPDMEDGRRKLISLGPAEAEIHKQVMALKEHIDYRLTMSLSPEEEKTLQTTLAKLYDNLAD